MTIQTISIHRALTLIAKTNEKLGTQIREGLFVSTVSGVAKRPTDRSFKNYEELVSSIQSSTNQLESALSLIPKLKAAISKKNLEVMVDFKGRSVSITELLAIKSLVNHRTLYLNTLRLQQNRAQTSVEKSQQEILKQVENITDPHTKSQVQQQLEQTLGVEIISGSSDSVYQKIEKIKAENDFLEEEIDIILSEINLATLIEVDM